ncbi:putative aminopeptidase-2 isoform X2 [Halictus rubicundus]|uniref:putative aminopeptidase-2 isoform X2 n=1 Tax=Halictus rubicundus TaxID=77578 RepID=UPI0040350024
MNILWVVLLITGFTLSIHENQATDSNTDKAEGFYRVNYDNASWYRIIEVLNSKNYQSISDVNRAAIVDDLLNLARAGLLEYKTALDGLKYLRQETNYLPFKSAFSGLTYLDRRFSGHQDYYKEFKVFVLSLIENIYKNLGYVDRLNDDRLTVLLRSELNKWACNYGHKGCIETFTKEFQKWRSTNNLTIKPNQRAVAYCTAIRHGTKDDWEFLWNKYINSNSANEQADIMQGLGCTEDPALRERYMLNALKSLEESRIRRQDSASVFSAVSGSGYDGAVNVLDFVQKFHKKMSEYNNGPGNIASVLSTASQGFATQEAVDKFENLIETHRTEFKDIASSLNSSLEIAKYELLWFNKNQNDIMSWIRKSNNSNGKDPKQTSHRLPGGFAPSTYSIHVTPSINAFTFTGEVDIVAEVKAKTNTIVLHSAVNIDKNVAVSVNNRQIKVTDINTTKEYDFLSITVDEELTVGQFVKIHISFDGIINDKGRGFYRSWYSTDSGQTRWIAATQMEPVGARQMFPCFDEPAMKAKFTMKVTVQEGYDAISNTQMDTVLRHQNGQKTITFKETPRMSTYLVVLIVSDFEGVTSYERYTVWARPNAINQTHYALSVMQPIVQYYEKSLNIPYQLDKLDMTALPDFVSGAMENWGVLTYKERNLLYLDGESTLPTKQSITNVISHEIAHQWFGNMVSPAWWNYTWLNEGFARYFQYFGTESVMKDWSLESQFVVDQVHTALNVDSSVTSHPMTHDVDSPAEIRAIFDNISYNKGGSVLRMIRAALGDAVFFKSLENYLKKREYDVATPKDLFDAFKQEITDNKLKNSIHDIMNSWTTQTGYPVVHVSMNRNQLTLTQKRFLTDGEDLTSVWHVPITWAIAGKSNFENVTTNHWLTGLSETIAFPHNASDLFVFNVRQMGFYRTNYDTAYWERLIGYLKSGNHKNIHEINRAAIVDDLMNFGKTGDVDYDMVLSATQYLVNETHYVPLKAFFTGLTFLRRHFEGRDAHGAFKRYVTGIIGPIYNRLGFYERKGDTHQRKLLRIQLRKWACDMGIGDCEKNAANLFLLETNIKPNYRSVSYCVIARKNDNEYWNLLNERYEKSTLASEKALILQSLACATEPVFLNELLKKAITENSVIRREDSTGVFSNVIDASLEGVDTVMDFVKINYDEMVKYYKGNSEIKSIVNTLGRRVTTEKLYSKYIALRAWLNGKQLALDETDTVADKDRVWVEKYIPRLHRWMEINYPETNYRLPKLFTPLKYNISISNIEFGERFTFTGKVQLEMKSLQPTSRIVINSNGLGIVGQKVYNSKGNLEKGEELKVLGQAVPNDKSEMLTVFMNEFVNNKTIILEIEYTGDLNEDMAGFYRSYYQNTNGIRWLATTQFQPTYARSAFPCFDEPAYKARFAINIERPDNYVALSNMPSAKVTPSNVSGRVWETFADTVPMSTYLVAFVVSDFKPVREPGTNSVNVWSTPDMASKSEYAQVIAQDMLEHLHTKTGIKYALPKLDLVSVPDFSAGAMENWGLATFREYAIQYDDAVTSAKYKDYVTTIIAHELTHMWFGNLVTCAWWENTWLNEGFAEYMQWVISDMVHPEHKYLDLFVVDELQKALLADDYTSSHPMNKPVNSPAEIEGIFDGITYGKGASVLRMVERSLDPKVFPMAINRYLSRHQYNSTTPKDLWQAFDEVIEETKAFGDMEVSMTEIMDSWTNEAGFPVVQATRMNGTVLLTQERFSYKENGDPRMVSYWIPITIATASTPNFTRTSTNTWMDMAPLPLTVKNSDWFIINVQQTGFYRVKYDRDSWRNLTKALTQKDHSNIHVTNRAQLVDDALNLARAQRMFYDEAFNCTNYLRNETEYLPWKAFFNGIGFVLQRAEGHTDNVTSLLQKYILHLTSNMYKSLGFKDASDDSHLRKLSRELILTWACKMEGEECVKEAKQLYIELQTNETDGNPITLSPNARAAVYCTKMRSADKVSWEYLWKYYLKVEFSSEKKTILEALGCTTDKEILQSYIDRAISGSFTSAIRKQDVTAVLTSVYNAGKVGVDLMSDYLTSEYKKLHKYYGEWDSVGSLFTKLAARISTVEQLRKFEQFINSGGKDLEEISSTLKKALEAAKENFYWYERNVYLIKYSLNDTVTRWDQETSDGVTLNSFSGLLLIIFSIITFMLH